ncbi:hypothetical protein EJ419_06480 [Alloscardovia theropitheci]|uniref:Uncharacterized protein n=1 Tax=Alloscardovia theropitheci TaxID=2496842 RepID=A0A4R0QS27_9BIFI|nr:hypothetical protein [Alloscardovia theropitheci]TCD53895.1 hypothetical protein EJ419_06480 [Alloscardovia theropitheci]
MITFPVLFRILHKYLGSSDTVPQFFREFMQRITNVPEAEWGMKTDASGRLLDGTIRTYTKRGISGAVARNIIDHLSLGGM